VAVKPYYNILLYDLSWLKCP